MSDLRKANLVWATPEAQDLIAYMARVSNPATQGNKETAPKLIKYLIDHKHWSPFEMVNVCLEINTTRDIARQILRHRSFSFQEFSQRYAQVPSEVILSEARTQDLKNRQNSIETEDVELANEWLGHQQQASDACVAAYEFALSKGIAKEVARKVLPEGLTLTKMYMNGTLRSWMHYVDIRCGQETQKEHREVAEACKVILKGLFPTLFT